MTGAPKPANFRALADAWDSPIAFATELARYYGQLEAEGHRLPAPDITRASHPAHEKETT